MADFKEDDQKTFYQEVTAEETGKLQTFIQTIKKNPCYTCLFLVQLAVSIFVSYTKYRYFFSYEMSIFWNDVTFPATITFLLILTFFILADLKKKEKNCYKIAFPYIILQTDLFYYNLTAISVAYSRERGWGFFDFWLIHIVIPVIPILVVVFFGIGCHLDKKREGNRSNDDFNINTRILAIITSGLVFYLFIMLLLFVL